MDRKTGLDRTFKHYLSGSRISRKGINPDILYGDNQSALAIVENPCYHKRTKHFDIKHHYIHDQVQKGVMTLQYLPTAQMTADIFTKALPRQAHELHMASLGMTST